MKLPVKRSWLIVLGVILAFASFPVPATKVKYQVTLNAGQAALTSPTVLMKAGYQRVMDDDKYGRDAIACSLPTLELLPGVGFVVLFFIWRLLSFGLTMMPGLLALDYAVERKMPPLRFLAWAASMGAALILIAWVWSTIQSEPAKA